jgi:hypothetical protein
VVLGLAAASLSSTLLAAGPLSLGRLAIPERLSASQVALAAIAVGNGGRSSVLLTGAQLSFAGPGVVATVRTAFPRPLSAASTTVLTFTVATGEWIFQKNLNASVRVTGVDTLTAQPVEVLAQWTAGSTLQTRPDLAIVGLGAKSLSVVRGQPFHAEVRIVNRGEAAVRVLSAAPRFDDPSAGAEVLTTWAEIPGNGGQHGFALTGRAAGSGGVTRLVSATVEAFDVNGGGRVPIRANLAAPLTLVARPRPELEILAIEVSRERLAPGETLQARVVFRVSSDGPLDLSTAELSFFPPLVTAAATGSLRSVEPFSPSTTLTFTVRAGTRPGKVRFTGLNLIATERATGQPLGKIVNRAPRQPEVIVE